MSPQTLHGTNCFDGTPVEFEFESAVANCCSAIKIGEKRSKKITHKFKCEKVFVIVRIASSLVTSCYFQDLTSNKMFLFLSSVLLLYMRSVRGRSIINYNRSCSRIQLCELLYGLSRMKWRLKVFVLTFGMCSVLPQ